MHLNNYEPIHHEAEDLPATDYAAMVCLACGAVTVDTPAGKGLWDALVAEYDNAGLLLHAIMELER